MVAVDSLALVLCFGSVKRTLAAIARHRRPCHSSPFLPMFSRSSVVCSSIERCIELNASRLDSRGARIKCYVGLGLGMSILRFFPQRRCQWSMCVSQMTAVHLGICMPVAVSLYALWCASTTGLREMRQQSRQFEGCRQLDCCFHPHFPFIHLCCIKVCYPEASGIPRSTVPSRASAEQSDMFLVWAVHRQNF
jgi:hypothetical protein